MPSVPDSRWPSQNPAARLGWRIRHSWWLVLPVVGLGCLGGAGFLYIGLRAKRPSWWIPGIGYTLAGCGSFTAIGESPETSALNSWSVGVFLAVWIGSIVHAGLINSAWLQWRAHYTPWYAEPTALPPAWHGAAPAPPQFPAASPVLLPPTMQPQPGAYYAPAPPATYGPPAAYHPQTAYERPVAAPSPAAVDVNTATAEDLVRLPGFDLNRAHRTLTERRTRSGFTGLDDFAAAAGLAPHQFAPLRAQLTCGPPPRDPEAPPPWQPPQGRVLDV